MVLLSLTLAFIVFAIVNAVAPQFFAMSGTVAGMFETLLLTVFGAYFAGRTIEKTMKMKRRRFKLPTPTNAFPVNP